MMQFSNRPRVLRPQRNGERGWKIDLVLPYGNTITHWEKDRAAARAYYKRALEEYEHA